jgi:hypothetical protein
MKRPLTICEEIDCEQWTGRGCENREEMAPHLGKPVVFVTCRKGMHFLCVPDYPYPLCAEIEEE